MSTPAKPAASKPTAKSKGGFVGMVAALFLAIGAVAMLPTTMIIVVGMIPTAVAYFVDTSKSRNLGPTVFYLNFAGVLPALLRLWKQGHTVPNSLDIIMQPFMLFMMFFPAAFGWLLFMYVPQMVSGVMRRRAEARIKTLEDDQKKLIDQWGPEVGAGVIHHKPAEDAKAAAKPSAKELEESFTA